MRFYEQGFWAEIKIQAGKVCKMSIGARYDNLGVPDCILFCIQNYVYLVGKTDQKFDNFSSWKFNTAINSTHTATSEKQGCIGVRTDIFV